MRLKKMTPLDYHLDYVRRAVAQQQAFHAEQKEKSQTSFKLEALLKADKETRLSLHRKGR